MNVKVTKEFIVVNKLIIPVRKITYIELQSSKILFVLEKNGEYKYIYIAGDNINDVYNELINKIQ